MRPAAFALLLGAIATGAALLAPSEPSPKPVEDAGRTKAGNGGRAGLASAGPVGIIAAEPITGRASYYGEEYRGRTMANGRPFDPDAMTAASWDFPLGSRVRVTHAGRSVVVTITDRGPAPGLRQRGRVLDLSAAAFARLAPLSVGVVGVSVVPE